MYLCLFYLNGLGLHISAIAPLVPGAWNWGRDTYNADNNVNDAMKCRRTTSCRLNNQHMKWDNIIRYKNMHYSVAELANRSLLECRTSKTSNGIV